MTKDELIKDLFKLADDPWPDDWHRTVAIEAAFYISGKTPADDSSWASIKEQFPPTEKEIWLWKDGSCWSTVLHRDDAGADLPATYWKLIP